MSETSGQRRPYEHRQIPHGDIGGLLDVALDELAILLGYRRVGDLLLQAHRLTVPESTARMIARTILKSRTLPLTAELRMELSLSRRLTKAQTHAKKLLEYATHPPSRSESVELRSRMLVEALRDSRLVIELALTTPRISVADVLGKLRVGTLSLNELTSLTSALEVARAARERSGRPMAGITRIVRGGCIAWLRAGRTGSSYWWSDVEERLEGGLPALIRDLISHCDGSHPRVRELDRDRSRIGRRRHGDPLEVDDAALHSAIKLALRDLRKNHTRLVLANG